MRIGKSNFLERIAKKDCLYLFSLYSSDFRIRSSVFSAWQGKMQRYLRRITGMSLSLQRVDLFYPYMITFRQITCRNVVMIKLALQGYQILTLRRQIGL